MAAVEVEQHSVGFPPGVPITGGQDVVRTHGGGGRQNRK